MVANPKDKKRIKAGSELCQAQLKLGLAKTAFLMIEVVFHLPKN
jgi:hypothetical protein